MGQKSANQHVGPRKWCPSVKMSHPTSTQCCRDASGTPQCEKLTPQREHYSQHAMFFLLCFPMLYLAYPDSKLGKLWLYGKLSKSRMCPCQEESHGCHHEDKKIENVCCMLHVEFADFLTFLLHFDSDAPNG